MTGDGKCDNLLVILNISELTNEVQKLLFSNEAKVERTRDVENKDTFNIGVPVDPRLSEPRLSKPSIIRIQKQMKIIGSKFKKLSLHHHL